jgi:hypothetical protein
MIFKVSTAYHDREVRQQVALWRKETVTERDLAVTLTSWIGDVKQIDKLLDASEKRYVASRDELERHLKGFAHRAWDNVIEGAAIDVTPLG